MAIEIGFETGDIVVVESRLIQSEDPKSPFNVVPLFRKKKYSVFWSTSLLQFQLTTALHYLENNVHKYKS